MKTKHLLLFFLCLNFPFFAYSAGELAGNGGDAILCDSENPFKIKVLDEYEAEYYFDLEIKNAGGENYIAKAKEIIDRNLLPTFPIFANQIKFHIDDFSRDQKILEGVELPDIPDSLNFAIPIGCELKQAIIRNNKSAKFLKKIKEKYLISGYIWQMLNENQKAILALHEALYTIQFNRNDSIDTRYLNGLFLSNNIKNNVENDNLAFDFFKSFKKYSEKKGFALEKTQFHDSGRVSSGVPVSYLGEKYIKPLYSKVETSSFVFENYAKKGALWDFGNNDDRIYFADKDELEIVFIETPTHYVSWHKNKICRKSDNNCINDNDEKRFPVIEDPTRFAFGAGDTPNGVQYRNVYLQLVDATNSQNDLYQWLESGGFDRVLDLHFQIINGEKKFSCASLKFLGLPSTIKLQVSRSKRPNDIHTQWKTCK